MGREDPLEKEMATHSSILAWENPWTEATVHKLTTKQQTYLSKRGPRGAKARKTFYLNPWHGRVTSDNSLPSWYLSFLYKTGLMTSFVSQD